MAWSLLSGKHFILSFNFENISVQNSSSPTYFISLQSNDIESLGKVTFNSEKHTLDIFLVKGR